ncbi:MAG: Trifunctional nucleotide phosphoesterase protein YfkN precursor [bacterium ADurb.Bin243]|nr:MAG: Trifunctional nucleotide phosphoesterase protein YfkN precursor [bacterium ADurb.Bin243]HOD41027.1 bifunctional UDP-sugar hydrolase/5'-nucleotidase [Candidatus Wallbacteria bacterium]
MRLSYAGKIRGAFAAILAAFFLIVFTGDAGLLAAEKLNKLTILYTNDTHSRLLAFDRTGVGKDLGGIERRAEYFRRIKNENPAVLIVDAGDICQGTPFYNYFKGEAEFTAFAMAGYEAAAIGNHDLDNGVDIFKLQAEKSGLKFVCANIFDATTGKPLVDPFIIKNKGGLRIAVTGVMGKESWETVSNKFKTGVLYADETALLKRLCRYLRASADLIVVLSHSGHAADLKLAESCPDIDVIIGAHTHTKLDKPVIVKKAGTYSGTAVTQAFENGIYAGRLDVGFDSKNRPAVFDGSLKLIDRGIKINKKSKLHAHVKLYSDKIKKEISRKIGESDAEMTNVADMFKALDTPLGSYVTDAIRTVAGADVFFTNTTTLRDRMPKGPVTVETALKVLPFDNGVTIFEMSGGALLKMMDFIALNYGVNESFQYSGVTFTIDMKSRSAKDVLIGSRPVEKDRVYSVATSSYIAEGNLKGSEMFKDASAKRDTMVTLRDMFIEYVEKNPKISAPASGRIKIAD